LTLHAAGAAGIGAAMRSVPFLLLSLALAACSTTKDSATADGQAEGGGSLFEGSRATEQKRLNAATSPQQVSREEQLLRPDLNKEFNPGNAKFGGSRAFTTKAADSGKFHFVDKTRTKGFGTKGYATQEASDAGAKFETKEAATKESWYSKLTAKTKGYDTRADRDANKKSETRALPDGDQKFIAKGRRQSELDKTGAATHPLGGIRDSGDSWSGDLKPLSIQDVKSLLNKN